MLGKVGLKTILCINHGPPHACAYMYVNTGAPTYVQTHRQINGGTSLGLRPSPAGVGVWAGSGRLLSPDASSTACPFYSPTVSSLSHILLLLPSSPASPVADRQGDAVNMDENSTLIWEPEMEIAGLACIVNACLFKKKKKSVAAVVNLTRSRLV